MWISTNGVLRDAGCELPALAMVRSEMRGLVAEFKLRWGARALVPLRRKPLSQSMQQRLASVLDGRHMTAWRAEAKHHGVSVAYKYGLATGSRADELTDPTDHIRRQAFVIISPAGEEMEMTEANLRGVMEVASKQAAAPLPPLPPALTAPVARAAEPLTPC